VAGLSPRTTVFKPMLVHVRLLVGKVALRRIFLRIIWVFLSQHHPTGAPYTFVPLPSTLYGPIN
jgi:hypothetical protein